MRLASWTGSLVALLLLTPASAAQGPATPIAIEGIDPGRLVDLVDRARAVTRDWRRAEIDFMYGVCEPDERVVARTKRAFTLALQNRSFGYSDPAGDRELREQLADRIRGARGLTRTAGGDHRDQRHAAGARDLRPAARRRG